VWFEELSHQAYDEVAANEDEYNANAHSQGGFDGGSYSQRGAHTDKQAKSGIFAP
jgi:hypothetical protein